MTDAFFAVIHSWLSSREESHHGEARTGAGVVLAIRSHAGAPIRADHFRVLQTTHLSKPTFGYWQRKLGFGRRVKPRSPTTFVLMTLVADPRVEVVLLSGVILKVPFTADEEPTTRWLAAAKSGGRRCRSHRKGRPESGAPGRPPRPPERRPRESTRRIPPGWRRRDPLRGASRASGR